MITTTYSCDKCCKQVTKDDLYAVKIGFHVLEHVNHSPIIYFTKQLCKDCSGGTRERLVADLNAPPRSGAENFVEVLMELIKERL